MDYTSNPITATFPAEATTTTINVPLTKDDILEGDESFELSISVSSGQRRVIMGPMTKATCVIKDSTSKCVVKVL